ncbi:MAG: hypothetical protein AAF515_20635 [Pseudomonadota bacterium]
MSNGFAKPRLTLLVTVLALAASSEVLAEDATPVTTTEHVYIEDDEVVRRETLEDGDVTEIALFDEDGPTETLYLENGQVVRCEAYLDEGETESDACQDPGQHSTRTFRDRLDVDISLGWNFDNFTAQDIKVARDGRTLANATPDEDRDVNQSALLDIRFNYEAFEIESSRIFGGSEFFADQKMSVWLFGGTQRTVRSTEVICSNTPTFLGCEGAEDANQDGGGDNGDAGVPGAPTLDGAFEVLRDAESLEGRIGLRFEFLEIGSDKYPARLYVSHQRGFASIEDTDDLARFQSTSFGAVLTSGRLRGSYIEYAPWAKNEMFEFDKNNRKNLRVHLEGRLIGSLRAFLETEVDYDDGDGSDSVRTAFGIEIPL